MSDRLKPLDAGRCAPWLGIALALVNWALGAPAAAQWPGIHPDPGELQAAQIDGQLELELARARAEVAKARNAAVAAKAELEAAVTARSAEITQRRPTAAPSAGNAAGDSKSVDTSVADAAAAEIATLRRLIAELKAERMQLLSHLTTEHPLIADADLRLDEYQQQLVVLLNNRAAGHDIAQIEVARKTDDVEVRTAEPTPAPQMQILDGQPRQDQGDESLRLEEALANWDAAQEMLEAAMDAESATAQRIVAMTSRQAAAQVAPTPAAKQPAAHATEPAETALVAIKPQQPDLPQRDARSSQPLVLAALILALVVAAIASVKLARATDASIFAGADDAAAALSLPVVGVIPAATGAMAHSTVFQRYRTLTFLGQVFVAVVVFAFVAFIVQNPGFVWQLVTEPWSVLR